MPPCQYGEAFERVGAPGMGRQGAPWCAKGNDGVLVLMAHQNYFHRGPGGYYYELPRIPDMPRRTGSAAQSLKMLNEYFQPGRSIHLLIAVFRDDGGVQQNGTFRAAEFGEATGDAYRAEMRLFDLSTAHLLCDKLVKYAY